MIPSVPPDTHLVPASEMFAATGAASSYAAGVHDVEFARHLFAGEQVSPFASLQPIAESVNDAGGGDTMTGSDETVACVTLAAVAVRSAPSVIAVPGSTPSATST